MSIQTYLSAWNNYAAYSWILAKIILTVHHFFPSHKAENIFLVYSHCIILNPFLNKPWFLHVCSTCLLKTLWEKEKLLVTSDFSFSHSVFYPFRKLSTTFIKFKIVICRLFKFGKNFSFGKELNSVVCLIYHIYPSCFCNHFLSANCVFYFTYTMYLF